MKLSDYGKVTSLVLEVFEPALYGHAGVLLSPPSQLLTGICVAAPFVVVQRYKSMLSN